jgi:uncharacterized protein (DUF983 family)
LFLLQKTGVRCSTCGQRFVILQSRTVAVNVVILICGAGTTALALSWGGEARFDALREWQQYLVILAGIAPFVVLFIRVAPRFLRVRALQDGEAVSFPLEKG